MELRDLIVTPVIIIMVYLVAYVARPWMTDGETRNYFFPALTLKIGGALALGFIYQFYYHGGDTYNFHTHGSRHIWEAFVDSPMSGVEMMFSGGEHKGSFFKYSRHIYFFSDPSSFFVIRLAALADILTFSTYSATAVLFAVYSFAGSWLLFLAFQRRYPELHRWMAAATLFIPSVIFWGSGVLKDTIVLGSIGIIVYEIDRLFFRKKFSLLHIVALVIAAWFIFSIKKFVLQAFLPAAILWVYAGYMMRIRSVALRIVIFPVIIGLSGWMMYASIVKVGEDDSRYAIDKLAETAMITAMDIRYLTGRDAGSGYTLGELDGSLASMIRLAPQAINVSLFRPYIWEVRNPLMLLSALESLFFLFFTLYIIIKRRWNALKAFSNPDVIFAFTFSLVFAFAVGISTFNFGTLARYKIPLLPFFMISLVLMFHQPHEGSDADSEDENDSYYENTQQDFNHFDKK